MAHGYARERNWSGNWRMEWVASTLHTTSEHGVSSITTADAHTSAASSRMNWRPRRFKLTGPFRRKTKSGFCACAVTFQTQSSYGWYQKSWHCTCALLVLNLKKIVHHVKENSPVSETGFHQFSASQLTHLANFWYPSSHRRAMVFNCGRVRSLFFEILVRDRIISLKFGSNFIYSIRRFHVPQRSRWDVKFTEMLYNYIMFNGAVRDSVHLSFNFRIFSE
jgi:hypothetical protein